MTTTSRTTTIMIGSIPDPFVGPAGVVSAGIPLAALDCCVGLALGLGLGLDVGVGVGEGEGVGAAGTVKEMEAFELAPIAFLATTPGV